MSKVRIRVSREFLESALRTLSADASVPVTFIAEVDGGNASVDGHITSCAADDTLSFTLDVSGVQLA